MSKANMNKLTLTVYRDGTGYRTVAGGTKDFSDNWKEYGETPEWSLGMQIQSLWDQGLLREPVLIEIVDRTDEQWS